jgi:hypothetical protein
MGKREAWHDTLAELGDERGFYRALGPMHKALYLKGDSTLVVSFDNLDDARQDVGERMPWGSQFISSRGWSSLGIGAHGWTWYRDDAVLDFFDELRDTGFFDQFERVVFYGTSMAGYAATVFSAAAPGAKVIAMNPQATLERRITSGWETRYHKSWRQDFSGRYSYGPEQSAAADVVYLFFDPYVAEDAMHAALYQGDNVIKIRCRHFGHGLTSAFNQMGILKDTVEACVNERPTARDIYKLMTARKQTPRYQKAVLKKLQSMKRPLLTYRFCKYVLDTSPNKRRPHFKGAMENAARFLAPEQL